MPKILDLRFVLRTFDTAVGQAPHKKILQMKVRERVGLFKSRTKWVDVSFESNPVEGKVNEFSRI